MAKYRSHIFSSISGSVGGLTYGKNASTDNLMSVRPIRNYPISGRLAAARNILPAAIGAWKRTTTAQKKDWDIVAYPERGLTVFLRTYMHVRMNFANAGLAGSPSLSPAPFGTIVSVGSLVRQNPVAPNKGFRIYFTNTGNVSIYYYWYISQKAYADRVYKPKPTRWTYIGRDMVNAGSSQTRNFYTLTPGMKYWVKVYSIKSATPYLSAKALEQPFIAS